MKKLILLVALLAISLVGAALVGASTGKVVATRGDEVFQPNTYISSNLRFSPGPVTVSSGETIRWVHDDKTPEPHTITLIDPNELPKSFDDLFAGCPTCDAALAAHFSSDPPVTFVDVGSDGQFSSNGDSLLLLPGGDVSAQINAPAGTTLYYVCAIHPWMQGTIKVN